MQDEQSRDKPLVLWLYVSADPALIQQTKLSLLNAQQKSSLAVIMHPPHPAAPQCTILPSPLSSTLTLTSIICIQYPLFMFINHKIASLGAMVVSYGGYLLLIPLQQYIAN